MVTIRHPGVAALAACALAFCALAAPAPAAVQVGKPAPAITGTTMDGRKLNIADYKGKSGVLLNFYASWCPPCRIEFPFLTKNDAAFKAKGVQIIAVNLDQDRKAADKFNAAHKPKFPVLSDPKHKLADVCGVRAIPANIAIDKNGIVVGVVLDADEDAIKAAVNRAASKK